MTLSLRLSIVEIVTSWHFSNHLLAFSMTYAPLSIFIVAITFRLLGNITENHFVGHTCDITLFWRDLPIFEQVSLFGISDLPTKNQEFPSLFNYSPLYLASQMYHMYALLAESLMALTNVCKKLHIDCSGRYFATLQFV